MLRIALLTLGDPRQMTGGYLFHWRLSKLASRFEASIDFVCLPAVGPRAILQARLALRRAERMGVQALVLDSIAATYFGPWLAHPRLPLIGMLHQPPGGIDGAFAQRALQSGLDRLAYRKAQLLLAASRPLLEQLVRQGVPRERLRLVPPGRDVAPGTSRRDPGDLRHGRAAAFLCVGNWVQRKGIHDLLESFARLPPSAGTLHLAGASDRERTYAARLARRIRRPDLRERVIVHGPLPLEDVAALYGAADVFVLPSYRDPFGTVYGEAMAAGLPVVGWRTGNLPHLADDEKEGLLLPIGDLEALTSALLRLSEDDALRRRLGEAAFRRAQQQPTWNDTAGLFFGSIREALSQG